MSSFWIELPTPVFSSSASNCRHYVLLDAAQIPRYEARFKAFGDAVDSVPLFGEPLAPERYDATPHLLALRGPKSFHALASRLKAAEAGHGALSWLVSPLPLVELATRLKRRLDARLPDDVDCVNRFFDGRVAPHLHAALTAEQCREFFAVAEQWLVIAPDYQWQTLECQFSEEDSFSGPLCFTVAQEAHLIDHCYPYAVLEHFEQTDPELLDTIPLPARYAFIHDALQTAQRYGIESGSESTLFCTLSMTRGVTFHADPAWQGRLEAVRQGKAKLSDVVKAQHE